MKDSRVKPPRQQRSRVLIVSWPDGHLEIRGRGIDAYVVRVPVAHSREAEGIADDYAELATPRRFRELWDADAVCAVGSTRPLLPSVAHESLRMQDANAAFNRIIDDNTEVVTWAS